MGALHVCFGLHNKENYYIHTLVALYSLIQKASGSLRIHILHDDTLKKAEMDLFLRIAGKYQLDFYNLTERISSLPPISSLKNFSPGCLLRLFIPEIIHGTALYLDSDVCVTGDIHKMLGKYTHDKSRPFWAACDKFATLPQFAPHLRRLGLASQTYFNSGVLLFHTESLRLELSNFLAQIAEKINPENILFLDQDILNIFSVLSKPAGVLPEALNFQIGFGERAFFKPEKLENKIIHYTWHKPWEKMFPASLVYWRLRESLLAEFRSSSASPATNGYSGQTNA